MILTGSKMTSEKNLNYFRCLLVALALTPLMCFAQQVEKKADVSVATTEVKAPEKGFPRLKSRNWPVCMCSKGMSESEIEAAMKKRLQK